MRMMKKKLGKFEKMYLKFRQGNLEKLLEHTGVL